VSSLPRTNTSLAALRHERCDLGTGLRHSGAAELAGLVILPHGEHIGYESRSRSDRRAGGKADVVSFAIQRIADPGLVDRFTRGLSLTEPAMATFIPAPLRVTSTTRRLTRWPES
jgi:2,4-dienoyl-CoA reductase-like NADH-dependent reductase (Old Yellow Enzyme family)